MVNPQEELVAALKQFMQQNQQELVQLAMETDPLEFQNDAIQYIDDVLERTKQYIVVPTNSAVDSQVEKKVKTNLLSIYKLFLSELNVCSKSTLIIYDTIIAYCNDFLDKSVIDNRLKNIIMSKLSYLVTGMKDNQELLSFDWSPENLQKHLNVNIDFTSEINTLFIGCPRREIILKYIKESCESLNHQYRCAIKIFLAKYKIITVEAKKYLITDQQCSNWMREIVKEINIQVTVSRHQQEIAKLTCEVSNNSPSIETHSVKAELLPPGSEIPMADLTKQKVPVILLDEGNLSTYNHDVLKGAFEKIDFSALHGLVAELNKRETSKSLLSSSIQHTLLPPPLVPPNSIAYNTAESISNVLAATKQEEDFKFNRSFSISQEP